MPLVRCSDQPSKSLEEFYTEISNGGDVDIAASMLEIIRRINGLFKETTIYGLTSLYHLKLLAEDTYQSPWYISIISSDPENTWIDYMLPQHQQPWPNARVKGEAASHDEAIKYIIIAMTESGAWADNEELKRLYASLK